MSDKIQIPRSTGAAELHKCLTKRLEEYRDALEDERIDLLPMKAAALRGHIREIREIFELFEIPAA